MLGFDLRDRWDLKRTPTKTVSEDNYLINYAVLQSKKFQIGSMIQGAYDIKQNVSLVKYQAVVYG